MRKISSAQLLGGVLRGGVVMAALLVAAGGI